MPNGPRCGRTIPTAHSAPSSARPEASPIAAPGASACLAADLNADARPDLALFYRNGEFSYHFNRGCRCFGEEGELMLTPPVGVPPGTGQVAATTADFNGDGSSDLAVAFSDGHLACYFADTLDRRLLRLSLKPGQPGPITVSLWQGDKTPLCAGTFSLGNHPLTIPLIANSAVTVRCAFPSRPSTKTIRPDPASPTEPIPVLLEP